MKEIGGKAYVIVETDRGKWQIFLPDDINQAAAQMNTLQEAIDFLMNECGKMEDSEKPEMIWIIFKGFSARLKDIRDDKDIVYKIVSLSGTDFFQALARHDKPYSYFDLSGYHGNATDFEEAIGNIRKDGKEIVSFYVKT